STQRSPILAPPQTCTQCQTFVPEPMEAPGSTMADSCAQYSIIPGCDRRRGARSGWDGRGSARAAGSSAHLPPQRFDLAPQGLVFGHLALEEARGGLRLLRDPLVREEVHVGLFVVAVLEVVGLDEAALHQRLQAEVHPAQAHAELARELALADLGLL